MAENSLGIKETKCGKVHVYEELPSTFVKAFELISKGELNIWDSVLAITQTEGIGQLRRRWQSPAGNLYVSVRIPLEAPFASSSASVAMGYLCARALRACGWQVNIKWPNDLIISENGKPKKVGGILLEEKAGALVAGIGINIINAPAHLRDDAAMPATWLFARSGDSALMKPASLWQALLEKIHGQFAGDPSFAGSWNVHAGDILLWRGMNVQIVDGPQMTTGVLEGISASGAAILRTGRGTVEIDNGSMNPGKA